MSSPSAPRRVRFVAVAIAAAAAWALLTGGPAASWLVGAPAAALAAAVASGGPRSGETMRLGPALAFAARLVVDIFLSAVAVAWLVLAPRLRARPTVLRHEVRLRGQGARAVFMNAITLTPGTLAARLRGAQLEVHALTPEGVAEELDALERRVARVFGEPLEAPA